MSCILNKSYMNMMKSGTAMIVNDRRLWIFDDKTITLSKKDGR